MNLFYASVLVAIAAAANAYVVEPRKSAEDDEKKIVVQSLAKYLSNEQLQGNTEEDELTDDEGTLSADEESAVVNKPNDAFDYKPNKYVYPADVSSDAKPPFAVPPTDFRFYLQDFKVPPTQRAPNSPMALQIDGSREVEPHKKAPQISSSSSGDDVIVDRVLPKPNYYSSFFLLGHGPPQKTDSNYQWTGTIVALIYGFCGGFITLVIVAGLFTIRNMKKKMLDAEEVDYPAYGVTGPNKDVSRPTGDRNLAHSAQMYHFHHQKSQIIAMEKESKPSITRKGTESGSEEDEAVYECPGLAPVTGEMEVKNPLFHEEDVKSSKTSKEDKERKSEAEDKKKSQK